MAKNDKAAEAAEEGTKEVRIKPDLDKYVNGRSGSGKRTKRCDDPVAEALDGFTLDEAYAVAATMTDIPAKDLVAKYSHLNIGMQRMNLGNRIRGAVAKLDKAHEDDNKVVSGIPTLKLICTKPRAAVMARAKDKEKADAEKAKAAEAKAAAKAKAEEAKAEAAKGKEKKAA